MADAFRLSSGGDIDRTTPLSFTFNGRKYKGYEGDTLASALLANGIRLVGRSLKYHRPRGIMSAGVEETNGFVQLTGADDEPNVLATTTGLRDGLEARSVNCRPSVRWDVGQVNDVIRGLIPAGFYYKTFMWPRNGWRFYGSLIRRAAGWGTAPRKIDARLKERCEHRYHHCDLLVVGAGPSGIATALAAGRAGMKVLWVDNQSAPGGELLSSEATINGMDARGWLDRTLQEIDALSNVTRLASSTASGFYDHNFLTILESKPDKSWICERLWKVRARRVVLATGAIERPLPFPNNDRPGIMLAGSMKTYVRRFAVQPGMRCVVFTNNNSGYESAFAISRHGAEVAAIVDIRGNVSRTLEAQAEERGIRLIPNAEIVDVRGSFSVKGVKVLGRDGSRALTLDCDALGVSGGWNPTIHLYSQSGGRPRYDPSIEALVPGRSVQNEISVGSSRGAFALSACLEDGYRTGSNLAEECGRTRPETEEFSASPNEEFDIQAMWKPGVQGKSERVFLDYQNDVTVQDIELAVTENFSSVELVKRYTTAGMGMDQGKCGNVGVIGLLSSLADEDVGLVGTTTYRPPYTPVSFRAMAGWARGHLLAPYRVTPITPWFRSSGAYMAESGSQFQRPYHIRNIGEDAEAAIRREALAARTRVGIYDSSTLGKFEAAGPDVVEFLNRVYTNKWDDLRINHGRFGFLLYEDGRLLDDGVVFRLDQSRYLVTTGTGTAQTVLQHFERLLSCEWRDLSVYLTPVTEQWAVICICGPDARRFLRRVGTDVDLDGSAFPFMTMRVGTVRGFPVRLCRVSFTGELSYEIHVASRNGLALWELLMEEGKSFGITPIGSDASGLLRTEKGFVMAGVEGDGPVNLYDAGMGWVISQKKPEFIGKRSLERDLRTTRERMDVVGLLPCDEGFVPPAGSPIVAAHAKADIEKIVGRITASYFSPILKRPIALALLKGGRMKLGESVTVSSVGRVGSATVVKPVFYDPRGERMRS